MSEQEAAGDRRQSGSLNRLQVSTQVVSNERRSSQARGSWQQVLQNTPAADKKEKKSPRQALPKAAELQERNDLLREECAKIKKRIASFEERQSVLKSNQVETAMVSGNLGDLEQRLARVMQKVPEADGQRLAQQQALEAEIQSLLEERVLWKQRIEDHKLSAQESERTLVELEDDAARGIRERRQLQAECLSLQQECEDARVELKETRDLLRDSGATVKRMEAQKLQMEWELQDQQTSHQVYRRVMQKAGHELADEAEAVKRQRQDIEAQAEREIKDYRAEGDRHRSATIAFQREEAAKHAEQVRLERAIVDQTRELVQLEDREQKVEEETRRLRSLEASTREQLKAAWARRDSANRELAVLEGQNDRVAAEQVDLQEKQAKLLLEKARRQASRALSKGVTPSQSMQDLLPAAAAGRSAGGASPAAE